MSAIVPELVNMATDPAVSTGDLLRKALVVARRLAIPELIEWIGGELNGYRDGTVPDYRRVRGQLMAENPMHGPIPFFAPPEMAEWLTDYSIRQSIPELIQLAQSTTGVFSHFPSEAEHTLMKMMRESSGVMMRPVLKFSTVQVLGVVEAVRNRVLEWALDLEAKGVIGDGMTFSQEEKQLVQQQHYHFSNVAGSQIQIGSNGATQNQTQAADIEALKALIEALRGALDRGDVPRESDDELRADLATLQAQAASPKPKWQIIKATASSVRAVLENAAGSIVAAKVLPYLVPFLHG
ncbi:hypothetical protein ACNRDB_14440 [Ralstonia pseudosolanacearum]|uniref:AbiTii domain-containing protein n=1 Tax=Ralstonia pseudosolanacearum TaxID=1310165 RepID=UPI0018D13333|nr:hypothetical protein [Ralstonia pseudosolanacearum]